MLSDIDPEDSKEHLQLLPEAFDIWLKSGLKEIYDPIYQEPIPQGILELLKKNEERL